MGIGTFAYNLLRKLPFPVRYRLRRAWRRFAETTARAIRGDTARAEAYDDRIAHEVSEYDAQVDVHDLPPIHHYWSNTYLRPKLESFGFANPDAFFASHLALSAKARDGAPMRVASIGSGNCDTEVRVARMLLDQGITNVVIECIDINATMLRRGEAFAEALGVRDHIVVEAGDFNRWRPSRTYDAIIANQSLHHVVALEHLFDAIADGLGDDGRFLCSDIIGRNGHRRWPEAKAIVREFWSELPMDYRRNLQLGRHEKSFKDWDCSDEGFEGVRAQDILPLAIAKFRFEFFFAYANVIDPFIDRSFGPHFDPERPWDRDFIDRVHARDEAGILAGRITPTHMLAVMRPGSWSGETRIWRHLTPAFCVRTP